jgi:ATP phosphoribosyltransferase regulatory subunit
MPAWLLPDHIADSLPAEARRIEELRRRCLDAARSFGFELVMPPLLEYADSLLSGTGQDLNLLTFKLTDQLSGKTLGLRADITPQVARIDAHLLNRTGVARLCYAGSVLHTHAQGALASREQQQFGAELYGHAGLEADIEIIELAQECLERSGVSKPLVIDFADVRVLRGLLDGVELTQTQHAQLLEALASKDLSSLAQCTAALGLSAERRTAIASLCGLYGGLEVLALAQERLPKHRLIEEALRDVARLAALASARSPNLSVNIDLADLRGYHYYSATSFMIYVDGLQHALVRGGRYDEIGAAFGRARAATGFGLYLGDLASVSALQPERGAISAPWPIDATLAKTVRELRVAGETVVYALPGHAHQPDEFSVDRQLIQTASGWAVTATSAITS